MMVNDSLRNVPTALIQYQKVIGAIAIAPYIRECMKEIRNDERVAISDCHACNQFVGWVETQLLRINAGRDPAYKNNPVGINRHAHHCSENTSDCDGIAGRTDTSRNSRKAGANVSRRIRHQICTPGICQYMNMCITQAFQSSC